MGDGGCAVLSSRHPLAEFRNSEPCHREQLKGRLSNWGVELGLAQVKERSTNALPHNGNSSTWPSVPVSDMEPGSSFHVGDTTGEAHDKQTRKPSSRWDIRAESFLLVDSESNATPEGPTCELKTAPKQVAGLIGSHPAEQQQQAGTEKRGLVEEECWKDGQQTSCCNVARVANNDPGGCLVNPGREQWQVKGITDYSDQHQKTFARDQCYQNEPSSGNSEGACIHSYRDGNAQSMSHLTNQETASGNSMSGYDGGCGPSVSNEDSGYNCEIMSQSDKREKVLESIATDYRRGGHLPHSRNENTPHNREHSTGYDLHVSKRKAKDRRNSSDHDLHYSMLHAQEHSTGHYYHGSNRELKEKRSDQSDHELHYSSPSTGCKGKENGDGSCCSIAVSDSCVTRDEMLHHYVERDSHGCRGHHKTRERLHESRPSSGHEEIFKHRNDSDRYTVRSSLSDKSGHSSHGRDYHSGSGNHPDRNGYDKNPVNGRSQSVKTDDKHHREQRNLDGKETYIDSQDCSAHHHGPSVTAQKDDSWPMEMDVPMDLSPAPAEDKTVDPVQNEHILTAPHNFCAESNCRGWIFLDSEGITQGPIELSVLKCLLEDGQLQSDHMVKLDGSNEWFTLEHAGSTPASRGNPVMLQPVQSLEGESNAEQCLPLMAVESTLDEEPIIGSLNFDLSEDYEIDKRVGQLMQGFTLVPGREKEVILEALNSAARHECLENEQELGNEEPVQSHGGLAAHWNGDQLNCGGHSFQCFGSKPQISKESITSIGIDSDVDMVGGLSISGFQSSFQSSRKWTSRGGDWKLMSQMENATNAKGSVSLGRPEKIVLNRGIPLCERRNCSLPDPRRGSSLYEISKFGTLELPPWACRYWEAKGECFNTTVENLNAISTSVSCTPKSQASTPRDGFEGSKKFKASKVISLSEQKLENPPVNSVGVALTSGHLPSVLSEGCEKDFSYEGPSTSLAYQESECSNLQLARHDFGSTVVDEVTEDCIKPVQQVPRKEDLKLETGEWFYRDGTGQEIGPFTYMQLQSKARDGLLYEGRSVYRKSDETWVPLCMDRFSETPSSDPNLSRASKHVEEGDTKVELVTQGQEALLIFHQLYPQFIGYMCGKLHEHVMKSYKSRDFAAMLHEGSRNCFGDKKSKKVSTTDIPADAVSAQSENSSTQSTNRLLELKVERDRFDLKHRVVFDRVPSAVNTSSALVAPACDLDHSKDSLVGKTRSLLDIEDGRMLSLFMGAEKEGRSWSMMDPCLLMRVFSFLETDIRSLVLASTTCKSWRAASVQFKKEITQIDLSSLGSLCSDDIFRSFTEHADNVSRIVLRGCTTLSPSVVKAFLQGLHSIESIDAKGCDQLKELIHMFPQISLSRHQPGGPDSHHKPKNTKFLGERKNSVMLKHPKGLDAISSDDSKARRLSFTGVHSDGVTEPMDCDTPHFLQRNLETSQVARSNELVKRVKLQSTGKLMKVGADNSHFKVVSRESVGVGSHAREKEQFDLKHKQNSVYSFAGEVTTHPSTKGDSFSAVDRKLEKDMAHVLQTLKELKVPDSKKVSSARCRASAFLEIEDKMRSGSYPANMQGFRSLKNDLFAVSRMLFRIKDKEAGVALFANTFRLIDQLKEDLKCRDISNSKSYKRKYQDYKTSSSLAGRKRGIGNAMRKQGMGKRRKGRDESSEDDERDFNFTFKTETSGTDEEDDYFSQDDEDEDTDKSDSEGESESEGEGKVDGKKETLCEDETDSRIWGARMTEASMVPPATRKYELIEEYVIVADADEVKRRMGVNLPKDYDKMVRAQEDRGIEYSHLEMPELREYKPRKCVLDEVLEQEVYGIDPYTHNLLMDSMPTNRLDFPDTRRHQLIEEDLLKALNQEVRQFTGSGKAPTEYPLELVVNRALEECRDFAKRSLISALAKNMRSRKDNHMKDNYVAYRKGLGVVCNHPAGFEKDEFIVEFFGEVYPAWRWFEKQDAIRSFQKKDKDPAPEFYNIFLERPKGDASGYDLVVVDAMHKANYASRICHSCRPNCEARVTAVNGRYQIGVYTLRSVEYGEELTFDYNSITESKEEHETSVCLCGSHVCRGSYLNFAGPETFQEIMKEDHGVLHRHDLLLQACVDGLATKEDWDVLQQAGLGSCLLDRLPGWTIKYAAGVVRFVNEERQCLPNEILKTILNERAMDRAGEAEAFEAEIQADGVFNTRLQNLAITLDKVRYVFKKLYGDSKTAPPPLRKLEAAEVVALIWKHENSVVADLLHGMAQHSSKEDLLEFKRKVREHEPSQSGNVEKNLRQSLIWLRDELCKAPIACVSRHDAAADLIHMYAYTKLFFTSQDYPTFESPSLTISPLDLGPKHAHKLGAASSKEWTKTYSKDYVLGQLIFWYKPNVAEPGASLAKVSRGCLILPDPTSCYAKSGQQRIVYGSMDRLKMFRRMEQKPQRQWNWKGQIFWEFKNNRRLLGSPMMDSINQNTSVNKEMMDWLKKRTRTFEGPWDSQ